VAETDVGYGGVAASLVLVAVAVLVSIRQGLGVERTVLWAATRAFVQLLAVGSALAVVLADDAPVALAEAWVVAMVVIAAVTVRQRAPHVPGVLPVALVAVGFAEAVAQVVLFAMDIFPFEPETIVPLAGMVIGNSLGATVSAARRTAVELTEHRVEVEARLALGQPWQEASRPYVRAALRTALTGQIESTKVVGLIALPGAMTGLILAGIEPVDAVLVQIVVMYLILGASTLSTAVVGVGVSRRLFTPDHRLVRLAREAP
jgi:putative ABC transport system permease protein